ncbi:hypothetical protein MKK55_11535 [Methylobacterium sp. J-059]|uniref:hypothetical protein n=1 Tax=Methylobacterium sp. J-059 TaxID=2836643 RepID=UPI001FB87DF1|nr:hypothetical protein [Methylobacterium sp. J-059]MCJ2039568.1 hypothetical protein [Methylobacterium sp. J-059]
MRNPFKRQPTADPISAMREQRAALEAKASTLNAGKDRQPEPGAPRTASAPPASSAVSVAIHEHLHAYAGRLYAEAYKMDDADTRAEQERAAFWAVLHTPLASDAERLVYAKAVIERASGVYGRECYGNTRAAWMGVAYRNFAFGEYAPESDMELPALAAAGPVASDGRGEYLARLVTAYAEDRASRPIAITAEFNSIEDEASRLVLRRCRDVCVEILALPAPQAADGLALVALAAAITLEVSLDGEDNPQPEAVAAVVATRALLGVTGTALPPGFSGFGDEPDCSERDAALFDRPGSLPAWAIAAAEAPDEDEDEDGAAPLAS